MEEVGGSRKVVYVGFVDVCKDVEIVAFVVDGMGKVCNVDRKCFVLVEGWEVEVDSEEMGWYVGMFG